MNQEEISLQRFLQWATELGISDAPLNSDNPPPSPSSSACLGRTLSIANFPDAGGRGLAASRDLRRGELVLRIPDAAIMTSTRIMEKDAKLSHAVKRHPSLSSTQVLAVLLLAEIGKGKKSFWYPYLTQIPKSYDILATFGPLELKALQVHEAIWTAENATSKAKSDWVEATAILEELRVNSQLVTFKAWLWASATISSRTMYIPWDTAGCLCPVGDFFNYAAPGEEDSESRTDACSVEMNSQEDENHEDKFDDQSEEFMSRLTDGGYDCSVSAYCFYAKRNYQKGEQVLLSYGTYTNLELLEHYGFLLNDNPNDKVFLPSSHEILGGCSWPGYSMYIQYDGSPSFALLSALRFWTTTPSLRRSVKHLILSGSQLSPENEIGVMRFIASKCDAMLRELPTAVEDDRQLVLGINRFCELRTLGGDKILPQIVARELYDFVSSLGLQDVESGDKVVIPHGAARSLDKWRLAVNWRIRYKMVLSDAISCCTEQLKMLSELKS